MIAPVNPYNVEYLATKQEKMGHLLTDDNGDSPRTQAGAAKAKRSAERAAPRGRKGA